MEKGLAEEVRALLAEGLNMDSIHERLTKYMTMVDKIKDVTVYDATEDQVNIFVSALDKRYKFSGGKGTHRWKESVSCTYGPMMLTVTTKSKVHEQVL